MTPLSSLLKYLRAERGLSQQELATRTMFSTRAVSAMETGRRQVRTDAELQALIRGLGLDDSEAQQLREAAGASSRRIRIPSDVSPRELRLVHKLVGSLGQLQDQQIAQISDAIAGGRTKP